MTAVKIIEIYVIYDKPEDYSYCFVMRLFHNDRPTGLFKCAKTLAEARELVPFGLTRVNRDVSDPPSVVESWL